MTSGEWTDGIPAPVGSFHFMFATQMFHWSAEVAAMHGYPAEPMDVTADVVMAHKHPEDRARVEALYGELVQTSRPVSSRHRIIAAGGKIHEVLAVTKSLLDAGKVVGVDGFYVDFSTAVGDQVDAAVETAVADFAANRAVIEQAKGMVMLAYCISPERAFDVLKWRSQVTNLKLRYLCELIVKRALDEITLDEANQSTFDVILLTTGDASSAPTDQS